MSNNNNNNKHIVQCKIVSIDGNIGAGKSSVLKELEKEHGFVVFQEDINSWKEMLDAFYEKPQRWSFTLQMAILNSLHDQLQQIKELPSNNDIIFKERAPASSRIFAEISKSEGFLCDEEFKIYEGIFDKLIWKPDLKLFIDTNVSTCMERIARRGRNCEKNIKHTYLEKLEEGYRKDSSSSFDACFSGNKEICAIANDIIETVSSYKIQNNS